jgi:hypothetical protein
MFLSGVGLGKDLSQSRQIRIMQQHYTVRWPPTARREECIDCSSRPQHNEPAHDS